MANNEAENYMMETVRLMTPGSHLSVWHVKAAANTLDVKINEFHPQIPNAATFPKPARPIMRTFTGQNPS